jgi:hypothetical protein
VPVPVPWPVIDPIGDRIGVVGDEVLLVVSARHPNGDPLVFTATGLPSGLGIDAESGRISGMLSASGVFAVRVRVTDPEGRSASATFTWTVTVSAGEPPSAGDDEVTIDDDAVDEGVPVRVLDNDTDPDGDTLSIVAVGAVSVGEVFVDGDRVVFVPPQGWTGRVAFTYTIADPSGAEATGLVTVVVTVGDGATPEALTWDTTTVAGRSAESISLDAGVRTEVTLGAVVQSLFVLRMPLTLLGSAVLTSLLLGGMLNLGVALHRGLPMLLARRSSRVMAVVMVPHGGRLEVREHPGDGDTIHRFRTTEGGVPTSGKAHRVAGSQWLEVEIPSGNGWVPAHNLTEHVDAESFADDPEVTTLLTNLIDALRQRADISPFVSEHGLWIAHHDTPTHYPQHLVATLMHDPEVRLWKGRNAAFPDLHATFDAAVAGGILDAWDHPKRELAVNRPAVPSTVVPVEFTNLNAISIGADLQGPERLDQTAWLVFFAFEHGHPKAIALTKEG